MNEKPRYKSIKVLFEVWQQLTKISAETGETKSDILKRLVEDELSRMEANRGAK